MLKHTKKPWIYFLLLAAIGLTIYSNTLGNRFVWDDEFLVLKNYLIKNWHYLPEIFTSELRVFSLGVSNFYRPFQAISYMFDYSFWRLDPFGYHLTSIILHILVSMLIYILVNLISKSNLIALLTSLLFLVHPIHTEVNSYISGRADSLAALFILASFILYLKQDEAGVARTKSKLYFIVSIFLFIFAILSKEIALVYPFILVFYDYATKKERLKPRYYKYGVFFIIFFLYAALRLTKLNFLKGYGLSVFPSHSSFFSRFLAAGEIIFIYLKLLFFPFDLHLLRSVANITNLFSFDAIVAFLVLLILAALLVLAFKYSRVAFFYYLWFLAFLLPTLNLFPIGVSISEHFLYLPSIGIFAIISTVIITFFNSGLMPSSQYKKIGFSVVIAAILAILGVFTYNQNKIWKNNISLYSHLLKYNPDDFIIHNNLGAEYFLLGNYEEAESEFKKALKNNPNYAFSYNNLGNLFAAQNIFDQAALFYNKAAELRPDFAEPRNNLGNAYLKAGRYQEAIKEFILALRIDPKDFSVYQNLGVINYKLGNKQTAIDYYKKAIEINNTHIPAYYNLGFIFYNDGDFNTAYRFWNKALTIAPGDTYIKSALEKLKGRGFVIK